jgi:proteic killer suppression protein
MLLALDSAARPEDMDLPGYHFHRLIGRERGRFSIRVTGNWRTTFAWEGEDAIEVDLEDYH